LVEKVQCAGIKIGIGRVDEAGIVAGINHGDRLAGAVADNAVRPGDLSRGVAGGPFEIKRISSI
jgi:hypothetical protein